MNLIKRIFQGVALGFAIIVLLIVGAGGMLLDLLGSLASALICLATTEIYINIMEDPDDEQ